MADTKSSNVAVEAKNAPAKKVAPAAKKVATAANGTQLFISPALSGFFWALSVVIAIAVILGNHFYSNQLIDESSLARLTRVILVIVGLVIALGCALLTNKGRALLLFSKQAYTELRKVVWPTRQEAVQTTFIVFVAVCIVSLFLYFCDIVFLQIVRLFTL
ncbi:MAG: preprotein translocase subunit SecE [Succinivibrio sp.]